MNEDRFDELNELLNKDDFSVLDIIVSNPKFNSLIDENTEKLDTFENGLKEYFNAQVLTKDKIKKEITKYNNLVKYTLHLLNNYPLSENKKDYYTEMYVDGILKLISLNEYNELRDNYNTLKEKYNRVVGEQNGVD